MLRVSIIRPSKPGLRGTIISGDSVQSVCLQGVLVVQVLANILRSRHWRSFWNSIRLRLFSRLWRVTPLVVSFPFTVPPRDRFLSPVYDRRGSYERASSRTKKVTNCRGNISGERGTGQFQGVEDQQQNIKHCVFKC